MKIFKCLSQNVSVVQGKEKKPERRKYLLGFRNKKRRLVDDNKTKECTSNEVGFNSAFEENDDLQLAGSTVKAKHVPKDNSAKSMSISSRVEKLSLRAGGALAASKEKSIVKTCRTLPTVQSTPVVVKCRSGNAEDSQEFSSDVIANSNTSTTTDFFTEMNVNMSDYLPSFAVYESPENRLDESNGKCSPEGNWLNLALLRRKSPDSYAYSSYNGSVPFAFYNSAVEWSSLETNSTHGTESTINSSTTCNKGCSTSSDFESSSSFASARSTPATFNPGNTKRKRSRFTTRSDTHLSTPAYRSNHYQKHMKVDIPASIEEQDPVEIACDSSIEIKSTAHATANATFVCSDSVSQAGLGCDSINFTGIDYDYSSTAEQDSALSNNKPATKKNQAAYTSVCYDSVSQAGLGCDSISFTDIDYDTSITDQHSMPVKGKVTKHTVSVTNVCCDSVGQAGLGCDSISFTDIDYDSSIADQDSKLFNNKQAMKKTQAAHTSLCHDSVSHVGRDCDSMSSTGIDYDYSIMADKDSRFVNKKQVTRQDESVSKDCDSVCFEGSDYHHSNMAAQGSKFNNELVTKSVKATCVSRDSASQAGRLCESINFTGIDYDYSITADPDSRILAKEQVSQMMETDTSQLSITSECPASPEVLKFMYIEQLMTLEHNFVTSMKLGIRKYMKPLYDSILTRFQHESIFMNIDKIVKYSEVNLKSMRENAAPDVSQTSEDQHMMLYLPAAVYDIEIEKQCQAYQYYGNELHMSNRLVSDLNLKRSFREFVKSQHASREGCPSIQEFVNKPAQHIQQLYTALHNIWSVTPPDSHDAPVLVRVIDTIFKCLKVMKLIEHPE